MTQPTLSRQMMELESELNTTLFDRGNRRVTLTADGMLLRRRAEEIVSLVHKTESELLGVEETVSGQIFIGTAESEELTPLLRITAQLHREYPGIRLQLTAGDSKELLERLDRGLLDFVLLRGEADPGRYEELELPGRERWGLLMPSDCPLAKEKEILPEHLKTVPVLLSDQAAQESWLGGWMHGEPLPEIAAIFTLASHAALMVGEGLGCALLPEHSVQSDLPFRPLSPALTTGMSLVWKRYQLFSRPAELFLNRLRA